MTFLIAALSFAGGIVYASFFEWALHRYILHSPKFLKYPFRAHQIEHHGIFRADGTYVLSGDLHEKGDEKHLTFAWWHGCFLVALHAPLLATAWLLLGPASAIGVFLAMLGYYALYESLHYVMHVPRGRWIERSRLFRAIDTHHRLHHVYYQKNLNVVFPIADWVLRTRVAMPEAGLFEKLEQVRIRRQEREEGAADGDLLLTSGLPHGPEPQAAHRET